MKEDDQNLIISKYCGTAREQPYILFENGSEDWYFVDDKIDEKISYYKDHGEECSKRKKWRSGADYVRSLDAMHEAEKKFDIDNELALTYESELKKICCIWHATAAQKAEAFLKTIGEWVEMDKISIDVKSSNPNEDPNLILQKLCSFIEKDVHVISSDGNVTIESDIGDALLLTGLFCEKEDVEALVSYYDYNYFVSGDGIVVINDYATAKITVSVED